MIYCRINFWSWSWNFNSTWAKPLMKLGHGWMIASSGKQWMWLLIHVLIVDDLYSLLVIETPGPWFNIKMSSYQLWKYHCGDKTVVRSSYLHNGISYTGKMWSLYWTSPLDVVVTHACKLILSSHSCITCPALTLCMLHCFEKCRNIDGLVQERRSSSALAMELRLSCTNPSIYTVYIIMWSVFSNTPFFSAHMCTFLLPKWCIVGYLSDALWDLWVGPMYV